MTTSGVCNVRLVLPVAQEGLELGEHMRVYDVKFNGRGG